MEQCTAEEINRMLLLVSMQRQKQALAFKYTYGQYACLKSMVMLQDILLEEYPQIPQPISFDYEEHEKPYLKDFSNVFFNISHCEHGIAVVVDDSPVGIDIESFYNPESALMKKTMNTLEYNQIINSENPALEFTKLWTQKESVFKLRGTGITDELHDTLCGPEIINSFVNFEKRYVYSVAKNPINPCCP